MVKFKKFERYINQSKDYSAYFGYIFLEQNYWDDYGFETLFEVYIPDKDGKLKEIGSISIAPKDAHLGEGKKYRTFHDERLLDEFDKLPDGFVSIGNEDYYINLHKYFNRENCHHIFDALNDLTKSSVFSQDFQSEVVSTSFFRGNNEREAKTKINNILRPLANDGKRRGYDITYSYFRNGNEKATFRFIADLNEVFPQNVQAIIGNNGVGKTSFFKDIISLTAKQSLNSNSCLNPNSKDEISLSFSSEDEIKVDSPKDYFSNLLFISFSPFDKLYFRDGRSLDINGNVDFLGLYMKGEEPISIENLKSEFISIVKNVWENKENSELLTDSLINCIFQDNLDSSVFLSDIHNLDGKNSEEKNEIIEQIFGDLFDESSSGHKIMLLSISKLVLTQKYNLVLIDEPELFLHPPLVSNFIRSISEIMTKKNALCILSTHSPIIVQEIPKDCVKIIERSRENIFSIIEPKYETFGENLSTLTNEIFKLDQYTSGFYTLLKDIINNPKDHGMTYEDIAKLELGRDGNLFRDLLLSRIDQLEE
ncbi:AAA family ATPase [Streptococcus thermophilus]|nr:AAA family ATPase [Streptococcus thermophilus]